MGAVLVIGESYLGAQCGKASRLPPEASNVP
jgi:hypothetical protein